tara:strand:- start:5221 stop:5583 length:363 start_codon:yes stop_codon:yes gene_type:complete
MFNRHGDKDTGILSVVEYDNLNFKPERMYYITNVPKGEVRGKHGHYTDKQYLICIKGEIRVTFVSKDGTTEMILEEGDSVFYDNMIWAEQEYLTGQDILLVLCSTKYDKSDYFYDVGEVL